tara:strand:- start:2161 stop:2667 length:507 start_codon:yes stop_codon:yes gene_type:complete
MNIFYLHENPYIAARAQYNKHVVKMVLESAQMLCTAHHVYGSEEQKRLVPYKQAHLNHPSTIWTRQCRDNYMWLWMHMWGLGYQYYKRYNGKTHLTITKCADFLRTPPKYIPDGEFTEPPQAMPEQYKVPGCSITAYWNYYEGEKYTVAGKDEMLKTRDILYGTKKII